MGLVEAKQLTDRSEAVKALEVAYLDHLLIYLDSRDRNGPLFRTLIDNWNAYSRVGIFLNRNHNARWFNNPDYIRQKQLSTSVNFVSKSIEAAIANKISVRAIMDHAIPVSILRLLMIERAPKSTNEVRKFLKQYYTLGLITKDEDVLLNQKGLGRSMPADWDGKCRFARYAKVGIEKSKVEIVQ
jgi:hypothetical protein